MSDQREILTWDGFGEASRDIARDIAQSGYDPDMILAIARPHWRVTLLDSLR